MTKPKVTKPTPPDTLLRDMDVTEADAGKVSAGKAKTADKAFEAMDKFIRG